ncbi:MAG: M48 family metallopeptidase [Bacteroidales bacterium]|nr:M48 family metallopeptidase [Bacteroidales bacterium]
MKKAILALFASLSLLLTSCGSQFNALRAVQGGMYALQALTLTDAQVQDYVHQYITQLDAQSTVMPESNSYTKRLRNLTKGITDVDGIPLNFKVYKENEVNAFACADGSVRVYTGIMDAMTDNELLGVIGHEIGHVALKHTRKQMQQAMMTSAALEGIASASSTAATLTDSQLGALGEAIIGAQFSKSQESQADDYGYSFLVNSGKNPWAIVMSFEKLQALASGATAGPVENLFSTHPDTATRIQRMTEKCVHDGYKRPTK